METVILKNGAEEVKVLVNVTMFSLEKLWERGIPGMIAVYELNEVCKDRNHRIDPSALKTLTDLSLVQPDGRVHDSICNIVRSACKGEGLEMRLGSPYKEE